MAEETKIEEVKKSSLNASVAPEEFDWDAFEGNAEIYGNADKASIEAAYDQTLSKVVENEVVEGVVTAISKREVIVNIGYKSEGVIQAPEFRYNPDLKVGDKVEVYVESAEDKKGQLILSHKKARALKSWDRVNEAFTADEVVNAQPGLFKDQVIHSDASSNRFFSASIVPLPPVPRHSNLKNSGTNTSYGKMR